MLFQHLGVMLDLVLPHTCCGCGCAAVHPAGLCAPCMHALFARSGALNLGSPVAAGWSLGPHEGALRALIRAAKYGGNPRVAQRLGFWMASMVLEPVDLVTHVPTRWSKRLHRGFDAVHALSKAVASELNCPHAATLHRRDRGSQVGRTRAERRALNPDAFVAKRSFVPHRVLLIDDVITTGTTVRVCAGRLRDAGAQEVWVLAAAHRK